MLKSILKNRLRRFLDDSEGYVTLEALIVMPALLWLFGVGWVYFDVFRQQGVHQKANYTIGDMISRETDPLDDTYINNTKYLLYTLTKTYGTDSDLRITVVKYDSRRDKWSVVWSEARGDYPELANNDMRNYQDRLPVAGHMDQLVMVETWEDYDPVFQVGLDAFEIKSYSFTRPRYAPQIMFNNSDNNNGWGNGDQDAPGESLCNNNAENADEGLASYACTNEEGALNVEPSQSTNGNGGGSSSGSTDSSSSSGSSSEDSGSYSAPPPPPPPPPPGAEA